MKHLKKTLEILAIIALLSIIGGVYSMIIDEEIRTYPKGIIEEHRIEKV
jgi:hypothetical protein